LIAENFSGYALTFMIDAATLLVLVLVLILLRTLSLVLVIIPLFLHATTGRIILHKPLFFEDEYEYEDEFTAHPATSDAQPAPRIPYRATLNPYLFH